jgi:hypothetical protein
VRRNRQSIEVSNAELAAMTRSMDELHHDQSLPALHSAVEDWTEAIRDEQAADVESRPLATSRRHFILGAGGIAAGGLAIAACGSSTKPASKKSTTTSSPAGGAAAQGSSSLGSSDAKSIAVDASIENLAIFAYTAGISAAVAGKLGKVPPAVPDFAETALAHHKAHMAAFNAVLTAAGLKGVMEPDPVLTPIVKKAFAKVKDVTGLAELAVLLENTAAQSYQDDVASMTNKHAVETSASIQPVEMTHAAILYYVLGKYPGVQSAGGAPMAFNPLTLSRPDSDISST